MMSHGRYPVVAFAAVRLGPSQVARLGLLPKKGVVQVAYITGTGGKTCSSISCSSASVAMLLRGAPARPRQVLAPLLLFIMMLSNMLWPKLLNNLPGGCTAYRACSNIWSELGDMCKHTAKQDTTLLLTTM